jgi:hypothetical protein
MYVLPALLTGYGGKEYYHEFQIAMLEGTLYTQKLSEHSIT